MISATQKQASTRTSNNDTTEPLLIYRGQEDRPFAPPPDCKPKALSTIEAYNRAHHSWQANGLCTVDTRLMGRPTPLAVVGTSRERKSPNAIANQLRCWLKQPPSASQAKKRAAMRLFRDALLATIRYYGLDPHAYDMPTDSEILRLSPGKVQALNQSSREALFADILKKEMPQSADAQATPPQMALHVGIVEANAGPEHASEECYVAFNKPNKPFWRRFGDPMFCVPIVAVTAGTTPALLQNVNTPIRPATFATRGPSRFERTGPAQFKQQDPALTES